jgi:hypothetical protein
MRKSLIVLVVVLMVALAAPMAIAQQEQGGWVWSDARGWVWEEPGVYARDEGRWIYCWQQWGWQDTTQRYGWGTSCTPA